MVADDRQSGVLPLLVGRTSVGGRHKSLASIDLKGLPEARIEGFIGSLRALGFRVNRSGKAIVVPARDRAAVESLLELERLGGPEKDTARRFDDRWWVNLVDAAADLADAPEADEGIDAEVVDRYLEALETFLRRGVGAALRPEPFGEVIGLADAVATLLHSGRPGRAADVADRLVYAATRLK